MGPVKKETQGKLKAFEEVSIREIIYKAPN